MGGLSATFQTEKESLFDHLSVLNEPLRCRILLLLEGHELTVSEICTVLQLPQSTVSRHLKTLLNDGWIRARREGTSRRYALAEIQSDQTVERLWLLLRDEVAAGAAAAQDRGRLDSVLARRRTRSQEFFSTAAGEWAQVRKELFGSRFDLHGLVALLDDNWSVGDLGCGTGQTAQTLAPFVRQVIAVDESEAMLAAARARLAGIANVELRAGRLEQLPIESHSLDAAVAVLVLHHLVDPGAVLAEAGRALKHGGRLAIVDMLTHDRDDYRQSMGHVWLGFEPGQIEQWLDEAGFTRINIHHLSAEPEVKGPTLFTATARVARPGEHT